MGGNRVAHWNLFTLGRLLLSGLALPSLCISHRQCAAAHRRDPRTKIEARLSVAELVAERPSLQVDATHCISKGTSRAVEEDAMLPWEKYDKMMPVHHIDTTTVGARKTAALIR